MIITQQDELARLDYAVDIVINEARQGCVDYFKRLDNDNSDLAYLVHNEVNTRLTIEERKSLLAGQNSTELKKIISVPRAKQGNAKQGNTDDDRQENKVLTTPVLTEKPAFTDETGTKKQANTDDKPKLQLLHVGIPKSPQPIGQWEQQRQEAILSTMQGEVTLFCIIWEALDNDQDKRDDLIEKLLFQCASDTTSWPDNLRVIVSNISKVNYDCAFAIDLQAMRKIKTLNDKKTKAYAIDAAKLLMTQKETGRAREELVRYLKEAHYLLTNKMDDKIYRYDDTTGIYKPDAKDIILNFVREAIDNMATMHFCNELLASIRDTTRHEPQIPKNKICLVNGVYDLDKMELLPHSPDLVFYTRLPIKHDAQAKCPAIEQFIRQVLPEADLPAALQEVPGWILRPKYYPQKAIMLYGEGSNGKSTYLKLLKAFVGVENTTSIALQQLGERFQAIRLHGKLINFYPDLNSRGLTDTGSFKALTGEDQITGELKFIQDTINFDNTAKLLFSANRMPFSPDNSDAYHRRWHWFMFENQFIGTDAKQGLIDQLTTPSELAGLFNHAIIGLQRITQQGDFTNSLTIEESRARYWKHSDNVTAFCQACCDEDIGGQVEKALLYSAYVTYCQSKNEQPLKDNAFARKLKETMPGVISYRARINNETTHFLKGIKCKTLPSVAIVSLEHQEKIGR